MQAPTTTTAAENRAGLLSIVSGKNRKGYLPIEGYKINGEYYSTTAPEIGDVADVFIIDELSTTVVPDAALLHKWAPENIKQVIIFVEI